MMKQEVKIRSLLVQYLDWSREQTSLLSKSQPLSNSVSLKRCLDLPELFFTENRVDDFLKLVKTTGYSGFHFGVTRVWSNQKVVQYKELFEQGKCIATHGTSIKKCIREGTSYSKLLSLDFEALEMLDPSRTIPINYDLFAGNILFPNLQKDFIATQHSNVIEIQKRIFQTSSKDLFALCRYIIKSVAQVFRNSGRKVFFEIPGTQGWSLFPDLEMNSWIRIVDLLDDLFPSASICVDLGHLLSWGTMPDDMQRYLELLKKFSHRIGMVHISSAGSDQKHFVQAYRLYNPEAVPDWHVKGLDLMLPVCEAEMLPLIREVRQHSSDQLIEVSEARTENVAVEDYFPELLLPFKNEYIIEHYADSIKSQAKILGYI